MSTLSLSQISSQLHLIKSKFYNKKSDSLDSINYSMKSRHSLVKDVTDENGIRQVVGCVPIDPVNKRYLFINNSNYWTIPEGNWDQEVETQRQSAMREAWELAGIQGTITRLIGVFAEKSPTGIKAHHSIYELEIRKVKQKFPEQQNCQRRWMTYNEAMVMIKSPFVQDAVGMSSLSPLVHRSIQSLEYGKKKDKKNKFDYYGEANKETPSPHTFSNQMERINDPLSDLGLSQNNKEQLHGEK